MPVDDDNRELLEIFLEEGQERLGRVARAVEALRDAKDRTPLLEEIDRSASSLNYEPIRQSQLPVD